MKQERFTWTSIPVQLNLTVFGHRYQLQQTTTKYHLKHRHQLFLFCLHRWMAVFPTCIQPETNITPHFLVSLIISEIHWLIAWELAKSGSPIIGCMKNYITRKCHLNRFLYVYVWYDCFICRDVTRFHGHSINECVERFLFDENKTRWSMSTWCKT